MNDGPSAILSKPALWLAAFLIAALTACQTSPPNPQLIPKWSRFEANLKSTVGYSNALQEADLVAKFKSPLGDSFIVPGFWDGGRTWKVRFLPDQPGTWTWETSCSDKSNSGLHSRRGSFVCTARSGNGRFAEHGPVRVNRSGRFLEHADGTPFFFLGDTAWSGPLKSSPDDWHFYVRTRAEQGFTAVQWVTTQFRAAPDGDALKRLAYSGSSNIGINPEFFQRLDLKVAEMNQTGLLSVPVLLWAHGGGTNRPIDPGAILSEADAIRLGRYMVARWQADAVVWILAGDGDYRGAKSDRWKRIGRGIFGDSAHAPVSLHPGGLMWSAKEFKDESWLGINGYQSAHDDRLENLNWITSGDPAKDWKLSPIRPSISLEAPYENHLGAAGGKPMDDFMVRRAHYWSLLNAPVAGITYGGHGVWGWDDGTKPPVDHPNTGTPLPWKHALLMPAAGQMKHLARLFSDLPFGRLSPKPELLIRQPGLKEVAKWISAAGTADGDIAVFYTPVSQTISVPMGILSPGGSTEWRDVRNGKTVSAIGVLSEKAVEFPAPGPGDWILLIKKAPSASRK